jgi:hypothetical protein
MRNRIGRRRDMSAPGCFTIPLVANSLHKKRTYLRPFVFVIVQDG